MAVDAAEAIVKFQLLNWIDTAIKRNQITPEMHKESTDSVIAAIRADLDLEP